MSAASRTSIVVIIVGVLAAMLAWLWRAPDSAVRPPTAPIADGESATPSSNAAGATSAMATLERELAADIGTESGPTPATPAESGPVLRIRLCGLVAAAPWTAPLNFDIRGRDETRDRRERFERRLTVAADGTASVQLPQWVTVATKQRGHIEADDPVYRPLYHRFDSAIDTNVELVLDVQVIGVLEGRVIDARGDPVLATRVTAFAMENGNAVDPSVGTATTSQEGAFHLEVAPGAPLLLIATPMQPTRISGLLLTGQHGAIADLGIARADLLPTSRQTNARLGVTTKLADMVLRDSARVTGVVQWSDGRPIAKAKLGSAVRAGRFGPALEVSANVGLINHSDGSVTQCATAWTDDKGTFELPAHPGQEVELIVTEIPDTFLFADVIVTAVAPCHTVVSVPLPIRLQVGAAGAVTPSAWIEHDPGGSRRANDEGRLDIVLSRPIRVRARHENLRSRWHELVPELAGTTVSLDLTEALTEVAIELTGDDPIRNATFRWQRDDGSKGTERLVRSDRDGPFELFLEPGSYLLQVGPSLGERNGLFLLPLEHRLDVGAASVRLDLPVTFGGHLTVEVTDQNGRHVGAQCHIRDAAGKDCTDRFVVRTDDSAKVGDSGELLASGTNQLATILPAGDYEIELDFESHGFASHRAERRTFTIQPREVTDVRIRLP